MLEGMRAGMGGGGGGRRGLKIGRCRKRSVVKLSAKAQNGNKRILQ